MRYWSTKFQDCIYVVSLSQLGTFLLYWTTATILILQGNGSCYTTHICDVTLAEVALQTNKQKPSEKTNCNFPNWMPCKDPSFPATIITLWTLPHIGILSRNSTPVVQQVSGAKAHPLTQQPMSAHPHRNYHRQEDAIAQHRQASKMYHIGQWKLSLVNIWYSILKWPNYKSCLS